MSRTSRGRIAKARGDGETGQGFIIAEMDPKYVGGEVRKVHIVYFLSRGGNIEHPHMIKVHPVVRNGVRLKDVKRWLSNIRGKDMPNSFAWSYKRKYRTGYVWQDLCDNDLITPISDNEYILKGSEILPNNSDMCKCGEKSPTEKLLVEELQNTNQHSEVSKLMLKLQTDCEDLQNYSEPESYKGIQRIKDGNTFPRHSDGSDDSTPLIVEYLTRSSSDSPSNSMDHSGEVVKMYKAVRSSSSGMKLDVSTQTGESRRFILDKLQTPPSSYSAEIVKDSSFHKSSSTKTHEEFQRSSSSKFLCMRNDVVSSVTENTSPRVRESRQAKPKALVASNVLRQLFTCGGIETRDSGIRTVKALTNKSSTHDDTQRVDDSQSATRKSSELPSPKSKSVAEISDSKTPGADSNQPDHFQRDVENSPKFPPENSPSSSSGEISSVKIMDILTPGTIADYQNKKENSKIDVAPDVVNSNNVRVPPAAVVEEQTEHTSLLNPKIDSHDRKGSRKNKPLAPADALSNGKRISESICPQCGRAFKAEYLKAHCKFCRGVKNTNKAKRTVAAK